MLEDITSLDSFAWNSVKGALNGRVVVTKVTLVPSKRNRVWVVETDVRPIVVKRFFSGRRGNEFEMLLKARAAGCNVPLPLFAEDDYLVTEYISGENCETLINHLFSAEAAEGIGEWLARFHAAFRTGSDLVVMNDAVLSNFILSDHRAFGVDLEDSGPGDPLDDLGSIVASMLGSEPFFTPMKFDLSLRALRRYEVISGMKVIDSVRPYVAKHLRLDAKSKPLFRRTLISAARSLEREWPTIA